MIERLNRNPHLFPDDKTKETFWNEVYGFAYEAGEVPVTDFLFNDADHEVCLKKGADFFERKLMPGKQPSRKLWEQFLHNGAPGLEVDFSAVPSLKVQVVPLLGLRIMSKHFTEIQRGLQGIINV